MEPAAGVPGLADLVAQRNLLGEKIATSVGSNEVSLGVLNHTIFLSYLVENTFQSVQTKLYFNVTIQYNLQKCKKIHVFNYAKIIDNHIRFEKASFYISSFIS